MKYILLICTTLFLGSCAMMSDRTYLTEMEKNDDLMFRPNYDFPVVSGDTGKVARTKTEIQERTPASIKETEYRNKQASLESELSKLEDVQTDIAYAHYSKYSDKLKTTSNKIYFLKIPTIKARDEYLYNLGLYNSPYHTSPEETLAIRNNDILLGMSKNAVVKAWGRPTQIEVAGDPTYENERWIFSQRGRTKLIYFANGKVEGWSQ